MAWANIMVTHDIELILYFGGDAKVTDGALNTLQNLPASLNLKRNHEHAHDLLNLYPTSGVFYLDSAHQN